jgi:hypothetical protein
MIVVWSLASPVRRQAAADARPRPRLRRRPAAPGVPGQRGALHRRRGREVAPTRTSRHHQRAGRRAGAQRHSRAAVESVEPLGGDPFGLHGHPLRQRRSRRPGRLDDARPVRPGHVGAQLAGTLQLLRRPGVRGRLRRGQGLVPSSCGGRADLAPVPRGQEMLRGGSATSRPARSRPTAAARSATPPHAALPPPCAAPGAGRAIPDGSALYVNLYSASPEPHASVWSCSTSRGGAGLRISS